MSSSPAPQHLERSLSTGRVLQKYQKKCVSSAEVSWRPPKGEAARLLQLALRDTKALHSAITSAGVTPKPGAPSCLCLWGEMLLSTNEILKEITNN